MGLWVGRLRFPHTPQDPPIYVSSSGMPELHGPWEATDERDWFGGGFTIYKLRGEEGKLMRWKANIPGSVDQWRLYGTDGYQRYVCTKVSMTVPTSGWKRCSKGSKYGGKLPNPKFNLKRDDGGDRETSPPVRSVGLPETTRKSVRQ